MNTISNFVEKKLPEQQGVPTSHVANPSNDPETFADPSGEKMAALVWMKAGDVRMVDANKPKVVDPNDVVLRVTGSTICGSDLHLLHGAIIEMQKGDILGHEFMGLVESVGPEVTKVKPGDRVVASFNIACGKCFMCQKKLSSACIKTNSSSLQNAMYGNRACGFFGYSHFTGGFAGGQAEWVRVPWGNANLLKVPDSVPDDAALYLSDVLATSFHCVTDSGVKKGDIVGIWGAGPIGILCAKWSLLMGASRVIVVDPIPWRLSYILSKIPELSPGDMIDASQVKDIPKKIEELTQPKSEKWDDARPPGLDVALECAAGEYAKGWLHKAELAVGLETDSPEILNEMIASVINYGTVGITGVYTGFTNHFNIGAVMEKGVRLIGNGQAPVHLHWEKLLNDWLIPGKIDVADLIVSHRIPIDQVAEYYQRHDKREKGLIKTFVYTDASKMSQGHGVA